MNLTSAWMRGKHSHARLSRTFDRVWSPAYSTLGQYGVRGQGMLLCALIWAAFAVNSFIPLQNPPPHGLMHYAVPTFILHHLGLPLWLGDLARALVWLLPAVYAAVAAKHTRRSSNALGWLYVPAFGYFVSYVVSFVVWVGFGSDQGNYRGLSTAIFYVVLCVLVRFVARIPSQVHDPLLGPPLIPVAEEKHSEPEG